MELKVAFLNCRTHGDCIVVTFREKKRKACIVVDGAKKTAGAKALADYLSKEKVTTIDLMVGTHIDEDHVDGLKHFVKDQLKKRKKKKLYVKVKKFWGPKPSEDHVMDIVPTRAAEPGEKNFWRNYVIQSVKQNDDLCEALDELGADISHPSRSDMPKSPFKAVKLELLGPDMQIPANRIKSSALTLPSVLAGSGRIATLEDLKDAISGNIEQMALKAKRNANNQSIVLRLSPSTGPAKAREWKFLLTGDAEHEAWDEMLAHSGVASKLKARVLKIPHHGSWLGGITREGAEKVDPTYSVNCVGQEHGLPDEGTFALLRRQGSKLLCTQRNQSSSHKSDCYAVVAAECPAKGKPRDVVFTLDTKTGKCHVSPGNRECGHGW